MANGYLLFILSINELADFARLQKDKEFCPAGKNEWR